ALIAPARSQIVEHGVQCGGNLFSRGAQYAHGKAGSLGQRDAKQRLGLWVFRLIRRGHRADTLEGIGNFLAQFRYERSIDAGVHGQQGAQVGSPVHVQHGADRRGLIIRADNQIVDDHRAPVHADFLAQLQLIVFEQSAIGCPPGGHDLGAEKTGRGVHLDDGVLDVVRVTVDDELVRNVFEHGVGAEPERRVLIGRLFGGFIYLGGRLAGQRRRRATRNLDVDRVDIAAQIPAAGIHDGVGNLARVIQIVRPQDAQRTLEILLPCNRSASALLDDHAQLADGIVGGWTNSHCARSAIMTSLRMHARIWASPSSVFKFVKENGFSPRNSSESFSITDRSAPTYGARSVLLMTKKSDLIMPWPALRGIFSPWATSMMYIEKSTSSGLK